MEVTEGVSKLSMNDSRKKKPIRVSDKKISLLTDSRKKKRIQVSAMKISLSYVNRLKKVMRQRNHFRLCAVAMSNDRLRALVRTLQIAIDTLETLKNNGLAIEKEIATSTVDIKDKSMGRLLKSPKTELLLRKSKPLDEQIVEAAVTLKEMNIS